VIQREKNFDNNEKIGFSEIYLYDIIGATTLIDVNRYVF